MSSRRLHRAHICVFLAVAVSAVFLPVLRNRFTGYDDDQYVTANPHVTGGLTPQNAAWAFTSAHSSNWHPVTWMSHQLDCSLFGLTSSGHHAVNLLFHIVDTVLLFLWLSGMTGALGRSAFVALIFGLHPLHVESVAWIAERKDVLSAFFALLALMAYVAYSRRPGLGRYLRVALLFVLGLMSKPMLITLPVLFLVLDWWPLKRHPRILEKLPLFALSALSAMVTLWAQTRGGAVASVEGLPLSLRLANGVVSYLRYLGKTVWPADLAAFYPLRSLPASTVLASAAALVAISVLVFIARQRHPWLLAGWCWFLVMLLPVIGIVQVGMQAMADRYMYLPLIGLLIAAAWELERWNWRAGAAIGAAAALACGVVSWRQIPIWKDGLTLFTHALAVTTDNFVAHDNLGVELDRRGRTADAIAQYREALRIKPGDRNAETNLVNASFDEGERLLALKQLASAISQFRTALQYDPALVRAHVALGVALGYSGDDAAARASFERALQYDPSNVEARFDLGVVLAAADRSAAAVQQFDEILRTHPDYAPAREAREKVLTK